MNIRPATPADAGAISKLNRVVQQLHAEEQPALFKPAGDGTFPAEEVSGLMAQAGHDFILAEDDGQPVGYAFLNDDIRPEDSIRYTARWLHIDQMSVLPEYQGRGVGKALVEYARGLARERGMERLVLSTWTFNRRALQAFERMGFRPYLQRMSMPVELPAPTAQAGEPRAAPTRSSQVTLRDVTRDNLEEVMRLSDTFSPLQARMVAPNAVSIAEAHFEPRAWMQAIYADETPVGFLMLYRADRNDPDPAERDDFLWRMMVARPYQGLGFGHQALALLVEHVRAGGGQRLRVSCETGDGSPEMFYFKAGFNRDGRMYGNEIGMVIEV